LSADPYLTGGILVLNDVLLLASVHPTRAIYQPLTPRLLGFDTKLRKILNGENVTLEIY
jgi:hypothetical protein